MLSIQLSHVYGHTPILDAINITIPSKSFTAILGPNGAGKSTLLKICAGVLKPSQGSVQLASGFKRAYMAQHNAMDPYFPLSVRDVAAMGFWPKAGLMKALSRELLDKMHEALHMVGLQGFEKKPISVLSGGQFQRLLFARLWLQEADLLLLDEPFSAIDQPTTEDLLALLKKWQDQGKTIITVMHHMNFAKKYIPQAILLNKRVIAQGSTENLLSDATLIGETYAG